jgi:hypothetical protein
MVAKNALAIVPEVFRILKIGRKSLSAGFS